MKQRITSSLQSIAQDKYLLFILGLFLVSCISFLVFLALNIRPSELQVVVHYSSFGTTNFYRDKWYYLLSFAAFVVVFAFVHIALTYRLLVQKGHYLAVSYAWLGIVILALAASIAFQVLKIASLT